MRHAKDANPANFELSLVLSWVMTTDLVLEVVETRVIAEGPFNEAMPT
jgi:hypothetical protein